MYHIDEFCRQGKFTRLFPKIDNIDYYSQFLTPDKRNTNLWELLNKLNFNQKIDITVIILNMKIFK